MVYFWNMQSLCATICASPVLARLFGRAVKRPGESGRSRQERPRHEVVLLFDPATAEHQVVIVEDGGLPGSDGALRLGEDHFDAAGIGGGR